MVNFVVGRLGAAGTHGLDMAVAVQGKGIGSRLARSPHGQQQGRSQQTDGSDVGRALGGQGNGTSGGWCRAIDSLVRNLREVAMSA